MIHIITGSTLGGAEYVGDHLAEQLTDSGLTTHIYNQPDLNAIPHEGIWLLITSTHGAGEYPDNIQPFIDQLQQLPTSVLNIKYAVIALGDSSYDTFCAAGLHAHQLLKRLGAVPISDCVKIDVLDGELPEEKSEAWLTENLQQFRSLMS